VYAGAVRFDAHGSDGEGPERLAPAVRRALAAGGEHRADLLGAQARFGEELDGVCHLAELPVSELLPCGVSRQCCLRDRRQQGRRVPGVGGGGYQPPPLFAAHAA
jgi:hypothetical protein